MMKKIPLLNLNDNGAKNYKLLVFSILLLGLLFRIILIASGPFDAPDGVEYDRLGKNLSKGHGFSDSPKEPFLPSSRRAPIFPAFLSLIYKVFGHSFIPVMLFQSILDCGSCLLVYLALRKIMNRMVAFFSLALISIHPFTAYYCATIMSETLSTFLLSLSVFIWISTFHGDRRTISYLLLGLTLGLNALCKPAVILLPFLVGASFLWKKQCSFKFKKAFLVIVTSYLTVLPWTIRNYILFDKFVPVTPGLGQALWLGSVESKVTTSVKNEEDARMEITYRKFLSTHDGKKTIEYDQALKHVALKKIRQRPLAFLKKSLFNVFRMWISMHHYQMKSFLIYGARFGSFAILIPAIWGIISSHKNWNRLYPLLLIILYFAIVHAPLHIEARYTIPARPYLLVFTMLGLLQLIDASQLDIFSSLERKLP